ncbi:MAG: DUF6268 family outer membrane beta-barrel protein [Bacteroidales bacterium]|nr:DUF6268 family outer membrane beta-barrel protein [Bacteroidales bacterium]
MKKYIILIIVIGVYLNSYTQIIGEVNVLDRDIFYLDYTIPTSIDNDISYQKWSTKFGIPPIRFKKLNIVNGFGLDLHQFNYDNSNTTSLDNFYNINYSLIAMYKFSGKWAVIASVSPIILSNLESNLSSDDFLLNGRIVAERTFLRKNKGYFRAALGLGYLTLNGTTQFKPIASIKSRLNEKWSFVLGIPNTYVKYDVNKKHTLKALLDLNDFSANVNNITITNEVYSKAVFTVTSVGLEYNYWFKEPFGIMLRVTQTVFDSYELRNNDNNGIYDFNINPEQPFITVGIKFNPIREIQQKLKPL